MDVHNQENYNDPQFVKVIETCLKIEIAEAKKKIEANMKEIERQKIVIRIELNKRRQLKTKVAQMDRISIILNETLTKLNTSIGETSEILEIMNANIDDQYKLNQIKIQEYQNIIDEYKQTWHTYWAMYEEFPLAKTRNTARINLQKLKIEYLIVDYKKTEIIKIIKQRQRIDWIRIRCKIIEFVTVMMERSKFEKKLINLKINVDSYGRELQSIEMELQVLRNKEEDQRKLRKQKLINMGPPKINHVPYRDMYSSNQMHPEMQHQWTREIFDDNISINTMILEELCINENTATSPEIINAEAIHDNDFKRTAVQVEKSSNIKNTIVTEEIETSTAFAAPDAEAWVEKADNDVDIKTDNDTNMKDIYQEKTQKSQESIKRQPSCCAKKNLLKHSATENAQNEIQAKRIRFETESSNDNSNKIIAPRTLDIVKEVDSKSSSSVPKIVNIESVHYNIAPISTPVHRPSSIISNNMFSPMHIECCESISSFDQDFMSKGALSLYDGSLCNYRLSPTSDISALYTNKDVQMVSPSKSTTQQNNKNQSDDNASSFTFGNFMKQTKDNFSLF
ncbi:unnamed protein product [Lasius platythorax]|uniref:Uncharacterized protein n=1 Tax=Lasius platythorax TaxID=488582 RepID=A0AAV2P943_9HYME